MSALSVLGLACVVFAAGIGLIVWGSTTGSTFSTKQSKTKKPTAKKRKPATVEEGVLTILRAARRRGNPWSAFAIARDYKLLYGETSVSIDTVLEQLVSTGKVEKFANAQDSRGDMYRYKLNAADLAAAELAVQRVQELSLCPGSDQLSVFEFADLYAQHYADDSTALLDHDDRGRLDLTAYFNELYANKIVRVENWRLDFDMPFPGPEGAGYRLTGKVYGDPCFHDGSTVKTFRFIQASGKAVNMCGHWCILGQPHPDYVAEMQQKGKTVDPANPLGHIQSRHLTVYRTLDEIGEFGWTIPDGLRELATAA